MIEIISARMMANNKQCLVKLLQDNEEIDFIYSMDTKDESEIYTAITEEIKSGKLQIEPANSNHILEYNRFTARELRNELLVETDKYFSVSDYPIAEEKKNELKKYRQDLRDVPQQKGFPNEIEWPEKPKI